jgi:hypothetical protein
MMPSPEPPEPPLDKLEPPRPPNRVANQPHSRDPVDALPEPASAELSDIPEPETLERLETRLSGVTPEGATLNLEGLSPNDPEPHDAPENPEASAHDPVMSSWATTRRLPVDASG